MYIFSSLFWFFFFMSRSDCRLLIVTKCTQKSRSKQWQQKTKDILAEVCLWEKEGQSDRWFLVDLIFMQLCVCTEQFLIICIYIFFCFLWLLLLTLGLDVTDRTVGSPAHKHTHIHKRPAQRDNLSRCRRQQRPSLSWRGSQAAAWILTDSSQRRTWLPWNLHTTMHSRTNQFSMKSATLCQFSLKKKEKRTVHSYIC